MLGMGAGKHADAQSLFTEDVCGYGKNHKPRHGKVYRNLGPEIDRIQTEHIAAFEAFKADFASGGYPATEQNVAVTDEQFEPF